MNRARFLLLVIVTLRAFPSSAQGTAFTYQGRLNNNGISVSGNYDIQFSAYNSSTGGLATVVITNTGVAVSNGLFMTVLDFGASPSGSPAWLELAVRTNGSGAFTILSPRQQLLPTPYAMFANTASNLLGPVSAASLPANVATTNYVAAAFVPNLGGYATNFSVSGDLHINGPANDASIGAEPLRIVRGFVAYDGTIESGSGFTVVSNSPGFYTITFNPSFANSPAVTANGGDKVSINVLDNNKILVGTYGLGGSPPSFVPIPFTFSFIAVGHQ